MVQRRLFIKVEDFLQELRDKFSSSVPRVEILSGKETNSSLQKVAEVSRSLIGTLWELTVVCRMASDDFS